MISRRFTDFLSRLRKGVRAQDSARLAAILQLNRELAAARDHKSLMTLLLDAAVKLFGAERGFVILSGGEDLDFQVVLARSLDRESLRSPRQKISSTVVQKSLEEQAAVFCEDAREGDFGGAKSVADQQLRSVICTPLLLGDSVLGCIYLDHRFRAGVFQPDDLPWFQAFADQGAIALHLHQLLEEKRVHALAVEKQNQDLQATLESQADQLGRLQEDWSRERLQHDYSEMIGSSAPLLRSLHLLDRIVDKNFPVLLAGESGTGKELAARAIHQNSQRRHAPFVAVNLAAMQPSLLESELFGHVRGAFTGADRDRLGLLREADGGVLFLDEVTELGVDMQAKLLRFLEDPWVRPVGADKGSKTDIRIVAATNRLPMQEVQLGRLRRDLYYRLAVVTIELPPLRERRADIPELVEHFLLEAARQRGGTKTTTCSEELRFELGRRSWPGNLRQLRNEVLRLDALAEGGVADLELLGPQESYSGTGERPPGLDLGLLEGWAIDCALEASAGNKAEAARILGISRRALYDKLARRARH